MLHQKPSKGRSGAWGMPHARYLREWSDATGGMPHLRAEPVDRGQKDQRQARDATDACQRDSRRQPTSRLCGDDAARLTMARDLVKCEFVAGAANPLRLAEMTSVLSWAGFIHLAVVLEVRSRRFVGRAVGEQLTPPAGSRGAEDGVAAAQARRRHPPQRPGQPKESDLVARIEAGSMGRAYGALRSQASSASSKPARRRASSLNGGRGRGAS